MSMTLSSSRIIRHGYREHHDSCGNRDRRTRQPGFDIGLTFRMRA